MNRLDLVVRIAAAERQLAYLREQLEKVDKYHYNLEERRGKDGGLKSVVIRGRAMPFPVATIDRVGSMTEKEVLLAGAHLLQMYRSSEQ